MENTEKTVSGQDFEKTLVNGSEEELNELKSWLFRENIRLEMEKKELQRMEDKFLKEKAQFQREMEQVNQRLVIERKRLRQDETFFDKKMEILKNGYAQLEEDRRTLEHQRIQLEAERDAHRSYTRLENAEILFQGVNNQLALKKRYKDLIKIFHPDNLAGDHEMVLIVNKVYEELKKDYEADKRA